MFSSLGFNIAGDPTRVVPQPNRRRGGVSEAYHQNPSGEGEEPFDFIELINNNEHVSAFATALVCSATEHFVMRSSGTGFSPVSGAGLFASAIFTVPRLLGARNNIFKEIKKDRDSDLFVDNKRIALFADMTQSSARVCFGSSIGCLFVLTSALSILVGLNAAGRLEGTDSLPYKHLLSFLAESGTALAYILVYHFGVLKLEGLLQNYTQERARILASRDLEEPVEEQKLNQNTRFFTPVANFSRSSSDELSNNSNMMNDQDLPRPNQINFSDQNIVSVSSCSSAIFSSRCSSIANSNANSNEPDNKYNPPTFN